MSNQSNHDPNDMGSFSTIRQGVRNRLETQRAVVADSLRMRTKNVLATAEEVQTRARSLRRHSAMVRSQLRTLIAAAATSPPETPREKRRPLRVSLDEASNELRGEQETLRNETWEPAIRKTSEALESSRRELHESRDHLSALPDFATAIAEAQARLDRSAARSEGAEQRALEYSNQLMNFTEWVRNWAP